METLKVGIRELRDKLASHVLETDVPVALTRHRIPLVTTSPHGENARKQTGRRSRKQPLAYDFCARV
jgi:hypothetical protein